MLKTRLIDLLSLRYPLIPAPMARMSGEWCAWRILELQWKRSVTITAPGSHKLFAIPDCEVANDPGFSLSSCTLCPSENKIF